MSRLLDNRRELSREEESEIIKAKQKWYPKILTSLNTPLVDLMADPFKKTVINVSILVLLALILYIVFKKYIKIKELNISIFLLIVLCLIVAFSTYVGQDTKNEDYYMIITLTKPNATRYDYESSPVVRDRLYRKTLSGSGNSSGSATGALLGSMIGSSLSSKRR